MNQYKESPTIRSNYQSLLLFFGGNDSQLVPDKCKGLTICALLLLELSTIPPSFLEFILPSFVALVQTLVNTHTHTHTHTHSEIHAPTDPPAESPLCECCFRGKPLRIVPLVFWLFWPPVIVGISWFNSKGHRLENGPVSFLISRRGNSLQSLFFFSSLQLSDTPRVAH